MSVSEYRIIRAKKEDVLAICAIETACMPMPWSYDSIYDDVVNKEHAIYFVAKDGENNIYGFGGIYLLAGDAHIVNIAVLPDKRTKGIGRKLLNTMMSYAKAVPCEAATLEVRVSNKAAIHLYETYGFKTEGMRKAYYRDTHEDAYIMWLRFD